MKSNRIDAARVLSRIHFGFAVAVALICSLTPHKALADDPNVVPKTVDVTTGHTKPNNVGIGFGHLYKHQYLLKLSLDPNDKIKASDIDDQAQDGVIWDHDGAVYNYKIAGVTPNRRFWVIIWADFETESGSGKSKNRHWMSVSDIDVDSDTDNNSTAEPREFSQSDGEDYAEFPGFQADPNVPGLVIGVNDDHDEFLDAPTTPDPNMVNPNVWGRDLQNNTANLTKEGRNYDGNSTGLAKVLVKVGVKRVPGDLKFTVPPTIRLFEGADPNQGTAFLGNRRITTTDYKTDTNFPFYVEGINDANQPGDLVVKYVPEGADQNKDAAVDIIKVLPVRMDIDVDSDNSGKLDKNEAEDLIEAKPTEIGMIVPISSDPNDPNDGGPGVLHGLYPGVAAVLPYDYHPEITLMKLPGSTGDVKVWNKIDANTKLLMLDTSAAISTTQDGNSHSLYDVLSEPQDIDIVITGLSSGKVLLGLKLTVNGVKVATDVVRITTGIDLDVDSDNDNGLADPARTPAEEKVENKDNEPGKIIAVNDDDDDEDGMPDFADGFNRDGTAGNADDSNADEVDFVPMWVEIPSAVDPNVAKVKFNYTDSDPNQCTATQPGDGNLRIWTKIKDTAGKRDKRKIADGGDFVPAATAIVWSSLPNAPGANPRIKRVLVEAVRASASLGSDTITALMLPDGTTEKGSDTVRFTAVRTDILADTNRDGSVADSDEDGKKTFSTTKGAIVLNNCNHSDANDPAHTMDSYDDKINDANDVADMSELVLHKTLLHSSLSALPTGWKMQVSVSTGNSEYVNVFDKLDASATRRISSFSPSWEVPFADLKNATGGKLSYSIEAREFANPTLTPAFSGLVRVYYDLINNNGNIVYRDEVLMSVAPYIMGSNIETATTVHVSDNDPNFVSDPNVGLIDLTTPTGASVSQKAHATYGDERWLQDVFDIGYTSKPKAGGARTINVVLLSDARYDMGSYNYAMAKILDGNTGVAFGPGTSEGGDSYGNLEVTVPLTGWPRGAIYVGDIASVENRRFMSAQRVQARKATGNVTGATATSLSDSGKNWTPGKWVDGIVFLVAGKGRGQIRVVTGNTATSLVVAAWDANATPNESSKYIVAKIIDNIPTGWLRVGHVDEVVSFVPDGSGWKLLVADPCLGLKLLADCLDAKENGNVASATATTFTRSGDPNSNWPTDKWKYGAVYITGGKGKGQFRIVSENTPTVATVAWDPNVIPDASSTYTLYALRITGQSTEFAAADNQLKDANATWGTDQWKDGFVKITGGACANQVRQISGNTGTVLTVTRNWSSQSDTGTATSGGNNMLTDTSKSWAANLWQGGTVKITAGTGVGQQRTVSSSNANTLTVSANWDIDPNGTSQYMVVVGRPNATSQYEIRGRGNYRALFFEDAEEAGVSSTSLAAIDRLVDVTKMWAVDAWNGGYVLVKHDSGAVEVRKVTGSGSKNDTGTSSAATGTTLVDATKTNWAIDDWRGGTIEITSGPGSGQIRGILSSDANTITVSSAWDVTPFKSDSGTATSSTNTTLTDSTKTWQANEWQGAEVEITGGTGQGQSRTITSNIATQITVGAAWTPNPDANSQYAIRLGAAYQIKTAYLDIPGTWTTNPDEASRYVVVKKCRYWDTGKTYPSLCIVEEILLGTDIRVKDLSGYDVSPADEGLPSKNATAWGTIWQDPNGVLNRLRAGVGAGLLTDPNIIAVPALNISAAAVDHVDALIPGMVNLLPLKGATASRAIVAKPYGCRSSGNDDFEAYMMNTALGGIVLPFFIDDWYEYHIWEGEVHCGTAVERDPPTNQAWWGE